MRISTLSKIGLVSIVVALMGQSCSLPIPGLSSGKKQPVNDGGVWRSDDHGQTWKQKSSGTGKAAVGIRNASLRSIEFDVRDPDHVMVATAGNGIWASTNGGESWKASSISSGDVSCLSAKLSDPDVQYANLGTRVMKSIDNGLTWSTVYADSQGQGISCVLADRQMDGTVWALTTGGKLLRSNDDGKTWAMSLRVKIGTPRTMVQDDQMPGHIYVFTKTSGIFDIDTVANNWQDLSGALKKFPGGVTINAVNILFGTPRIWTIGTNYGLLQSFDHGATWTAIPTLLTTHSTPFRAVVINPRNQQEMLFAVGHAIHHTIDGGATWNVTSVSTSRTIVSLTFDPVRTDRMYITTFATQ